MSEIRDQMATLSADLNAQRIMLHAVLIELAMLAEPESARARGRWVEDIFAEMATVADLLPAPNPEMVKFKRRMKAILSASAKEVARQFGTDLDS